MEIKKSPAYNDLKEDITNFVAMCGYDLLTDIQATGSPMTFGFKNNGATYLVSLLPSVNDSTADGSIALTIDRIRKRFLLPLQYEPVVREEMKVKINSINKKDINEVLEDALAKIRLSTKVGIADSREPLTFSYADKQAEILFEKDAHNVTTYIYIG